MPGFGSDQFGRDPFGEWSWSRQVFYDYVPEPDRVSDPQGLLKLFLDSVRTTYESHRHRVRDFPNLRTAFLVRTQYTDVERLRLGPVIVPQGALEQQGIGGYVDALTQFVTPSARFRPEDVGKELRISGSLVVGNNKAVTIVTVVNFTTVLTMPPLAIDAGSLRWELREKVEVPTDYVVVEVRGGNASPITPGWLLADGRGEYEVLARQQFLPSGVMALQNEREGSDGELLGDSTFQATSGNFTAHDVGKWIALSGSDTETNNTQFEIVGFDPLTSILTLKGPPTTASSELFWGLRPHARVALKGLTIPLGVVEQEGSDGVLTSATTTFTTATGNFASADEGKWLFLPGVPGRSRPIEAEVVSVVDANTLTLSVTSPGSYTDLVWELRSSPRTSDVERSGIDLEIVEISASDTRVATVLIPSGKFVTADIGSLLRLTNSENEDNNDTYVITAVEDYDLIEITRGYPAPSGDDIVVDAGPLTWELIEPQFLPFDPAELGMSSRIAARAESLIQHLAPDFGIEIDTQESEARQRSWVANVNVWLDKKGHEDGYKIIGSISGFDVTVFQLWRIDASYLELLSSSEVFEVGEEGEGHSGTDGTLEMYLGDLTFISPTADFTTSDVGLCLRIGNAADSANNSIYTIEEVYSDDATRALLRPALPSVPEYGDGGTAVAPTLTWSMVRLFAVNPPTRPRFDDFNADAMTEWIDANPPADDESVVDQFCWEENFAAFVEVSISAVTLIEGNRYSVTMVPTTGVSDLDIIPDQDSATAIRLDLPIWKITDSAGNTFTLETIPSVTIGGGTAWVTEIIASPLAPPVTGVGTLNYQCLDLADCGWCGSSAVAVVLEEGSIATEAGVQVERVLERVLIRLAQHPRPIHVRLIPIFKRILEATWDMTAEIEAFEIFSTLYAPFGAYYDEIPADDIPGDYAVLAEVESTESVWVGGFDE